MKIIKTVLLTLIFILIFQSSCQADGNVLLQECLAAEKYIDTEKMTKPFSVGMCWGLIQGVRNTMQLLGEDVPLSIRACLPERGIDNGQATRVVVAYLKKNPALLHKNEVVLTMLAFLDAYPCK